MGKKEMGLFDFEDKIIGFKNSTLKIIVIVIILLPVLLITKALIDNYYGENKYLSYENQMVDKVKAYIHNNTFEIEDNSYAYVDLYTLGMDLRANMHCSKSSGVIVTYYDSKLQYNPYLICKDYETPVKGFSDAKGSDDYITLKGLNPMIISGAYEEPGYNVDSNYQVEVTSNVSKAPGLYVVNYNVYDRGILTANVKRVVIVGDYTDEDKINNPYPTITLLGDTNMTVTKGSVYTDPGYKAYDSISGDITSKVKIYGTVNTNRVGEYNITYSVISSRGRNNKQVRVVTVAEDAKNKLNVQLTSKYNSNKGITISASIKGDSYFYTVLPNYNKNFGTNFNYDVYVNGTYDFLVYDRNYNYTKASITISNIDKDGPSATCINTITNNQSTITVTASDSISGIIGYSYSNGSTNYTDYIKDNHHTFTTSNKNAFVKIKDNSGNITNIACSLVNSNTTTTNPPATFDMNPVKDRTKTITCGTDPTIYNNALKTKIDASGIKTRWAVVQAAIYLTNDFPFEIPYFWAGKYAEIGVNKEWGCDKPIPSTGTERQPGGTIWPYGLDCSGFVKWSFVNGGFDANTIPRTMFHTTKWGNWEPVVYSFKQIKQNQQLYNSVKPGDVLIMPGHYALIIGVDDKRIKVAQSSGGSKAKVNVIFLDRDTGKATDNSMTFTSIVFMDDFYEMYGN